MKDEILLRALDTVEDEATLISFMRLLSKDRAEAVLAENTRPSNPYGPYAGDWQNPTIAAFLEAAARWAEDSNFGRNLAIRLPKSNLWRLFAECLYAGKIYE